MADTAAALLNEIAALEAGAAEDKRLVGHHRRALTSKMEQLRVLKARYAALGIRYMQETTDGSTGAHGSVDHPRRAHG